MIRTYARFTDDGAPARRVVPRRRGRKEFLNAVQQENMARYVEKYDRGSRNGNDQSDGLLGRVN